MPEQQPEKLEKHIRLLEDASGFTPEELDLDPAELQQFIKAQRGLNLIRKTVERDKVPVEPDAESKSTAVGQGSQDTVIEKPNREPADPLPTIGRFEIIRELGRGGFGIVLLARDPRLDRQVALKIPKVHSIDNEELSLRFDREARSAAMLGHPNIVPLFESGSVGPVKYIAFEYCPGKSLSQWLKSNDQRPKPDESAKIIATLADAVQHAHSRGVIHRDLKPGNILLEEDTATPRITDFGLAKIAGPDESMTQTGAALGTPAYMSPEQARGELTEVGPASDIYSLGAILYELLTGRPPFSGKTHLQTLHSIQEKPVVPPSTTNSAVPKDLQAICLKCLEKSSADRFHTAHELESDLRRFLAGEPVLARPATQFNRLTKFARRNKTLATVSVISAIVLFTAAIVSTVFGFNAANQRHLADQRLVQAERDAAISLATEKFLNEDLLAGANPDMAMNPNMTVRQALDIAAGKIAGQFEEMPVVEASIRSTIGRTYLSLGEIETAESHLEQSISILYQELGERHERTISTELTYASLLRAKGQYDDAESKLKQLIEIADQELGSEHLLPLLIRNEIAGGKYSKGQYEECEEVLRRLLVDVDRFPYDQTRNIRFSTMNLLSLVLLKQDRKTEAESVARSVFELTRESDPADADSRIQFIGNFHETATNNLAVVLMESNELGEAETLFKAVLESQQRSNGNDPSILSSLINLSDIFQRQQRWDDAIEILKEIIPNSRTINGEKHPKTLAAMSVLAHIYQRLRRIDEAGPLLEQILVIRRQTLGEDHPETLVTMNNVAGIKFATGDYEAAEETLRDVYKGMQKTFGPIHSNTLGVLNNLGVMLMTQGMYSKAEAIFLELLELIRPNGDESTPAVARTINSLAEVYRRNGDPKRAEPLHRAALQMRRELLGNKHADVATSINNLANALNELGDSDAAIKLHRESLTIRSEVFGEQHPSVASSLGGLAHALGKNGESEEAIELQRQALALRQKSLGPDHPNTLHFMLGLSRLLMEAEQSAEALELAQSTYEIQNKKLGSDHPDLVSTIQLLATLLMDRGENGEAESFLNTSFEIIQSQNSSGNKKRGELFELFKRLYGPDHLDDPAKLDQVRTNLIDES